MKLGVLMDPIEQIHIKTDTTFAFLLEAQRRHYQTFYLEAHNVYLKNNTARARIRPITVKDHATQWFALGDYKDQALVDLDCLLMRKDPPINKSYLHLTYLLEIAENQGLRVVNKPSSLRDANEKLFATEFPQCTPPTQVTTSIDDLRQWVATEKRIVVKPLNAMGGHSIFIVEDKDPNLYVILETITQQETQWAMAQPFIDSIYQKGDKRILLIQGKPIPYALTRQPKMGDFRGNISRGAHTTVSKLTDQDRWICDQVSQTLVEKGLMFVGLDIIDRYLTEINITSPTGVRELESSLDISIAGDFFNALEAS